MSGENENQVEDTNPDTAVLDAVPAQDEVFQVSETSETSETSAAAAPPADNDPAQDESAEEGKKESPLDRILNIMNRDKKDEGAKAPASVEDATQADKDQQGDSKAAGDNAADSPAADKKSEDVPKEIAEHPAYKALEEKTKEYEDAHNRVTQISNFMTENNLAPEDMSSAMNVAALRKSSQVPQQEFERADQMTILAYTEPEKFYESLGAMYQEFGVMLGKTLPDDLAQDVEDGNITEERAKELATARVKEQTATAKARSATEKSEKSEAATIEQARGSIVDSWFEKASKTDLELNHKVNAIEGEIYRLSARRNAEGKPAPRNEKEWFDFLDECHKNVTENMKIGRTKQPVDPAPRSNPAPQNVDTQPKQTPDQQAVSNILNVMNRDAA